MSDTFKATTLFVNKHEGGFYEICFDNQTASVNKFDRKTVSELKTAVEFIQAQKDLQGLMLTSGKAVFFVGADVTEFTTLFAEGEKSITNWLQTSHDIFSAIEDLPVPTVTAIGGICLGGGMEVALTTCYRIASKKARLGLPEVKLGIFPGWGGTVRLPRIAGADTAIEWICAGNQYKPEEALKQGVVDAVVEEALLQKAALDLLRRARSGELDWKSRQQEKLLPLTLLSPVEEVMVFEGAKAFVAAQAGPHYPAPLAAVKVMQKACRMGRKEAIAVEIAGILEIVKGSVPTSLIGVFLAEQFNKKQAEEYAKKAVTKVSRSAVLGAGIMGGGIAYQSASKGIPILMKDVQPKALELGMMEAGKLLNKIAELGKITSKEVALIMGSITPTLSYGDFKAVDLVVEAVVESEAIKAKVLAEVEKEVRENVVLASNTSTISISKLAKNLKRPEQFCGMHFFNPVHKMPLVEIIRGEKSSEETIGTTVAYALQMGKIPVVVNDCPGFLVNRILFPYLSALNGLIEEGIEYERIDKVMEQYGWPMGPAHLLDVVGIDTAVHASEVMLNAYPLRLNKFAGAGPLKLLKQHERLGQKSGRGFYAYETDGKGRPKKRVDAEAVALVSTLVCAKREVSDEEIVDRMMIPFLNESAVCLEEKIAATPQEVDLALVYGLGFPPFRGGAFRLLDHMGAGEFVKRAERLAHYGNCYQVAPMIASAAKSGRKFY
ncbi:MAG: fatty acid oxidation complex subunit alpha FadB [Oligoflexia bacterium]|nr:fatty acid oxidation complex subunit alpha FadB [Oligoflexia bacterium]MBF0365198.1 fatty acid oxidation complex subunit alpha FadB [Oligoflexia bacterium]